MFFTRGFSTELAFLALAPKAINGFNLFTLDSYT